MSRNSCFSHRLRKYINNTLDRSSAFGSQVIAVHSSASPSLESLSTGTVIMSLRLLQLTRALSSQRLNPVSPYSPVNKRPENPYNLFKFLDERPLEHLFVGEPVPKQGVSETDTNIRSDCLKLYLRKTARERHLRRSISLGSKHT